MSTKRKVKTVCFSRDSTEELDIEIEFHILDLEAEKFGIETCQVRCESMVFGKLLHLKSLSSLCASDLYVKNYDG